MKHLNPGGAPIIKTAAYTLLAAQSGSTFVADAVDLVFTLPSAAAGLAYTIVVGTVSATTGCQVSPAAADSINDGVANKDYINTAATDVIGDSITVVCDGATWWTTSMHGIWAAEA